MSTPVLVLYGGQSSEHEVSCRSAKFIIKTLIESNYQIGVIAIDRDGVWYPQDPIKLLNLGKEQLPILKDENFPPEPNQVGWNPGDKIVSFMSHKVSRKLSPGEICVFMVTHGTHGEDGILQGFLELSGFSYVGPDTLGSAVGMDKHIAKVLVEKAGLPVAPFIALRRNEWEKVDQLFLQNSVCDWGMPLFVKPASLGSSVGISKVTRREDLEKAIVEAFRFDEKILIEKGLDIREIECATLGGYDPAVSRAGEINATAEFYSYDAKYVAQDGALIRVPAALDEKQELMVQELSRKAFQALQLYGIARVDWFLEKTSGKFYFNEVNTLPGFTSISQYPKLWEASGLSPEKLLAKMIDVSLERRKMRSKLLRSV